MAHPVAVDVNSPARTCDAVARWAEDEIMAASPVATDVKGLLSPYVVVPVMSADESMGNLMEENVSYGIHGLPYEISRDADGACA